jgi:hypothetical protein
MTNETREGLDQNDPESPTLDKTSFFSQVGGRETVLAEDAAQNPCKKHLFAKTEPTVDINRVKLKDLASENLVSSTRKEILLDIDNIIVDKTVRNQSASNNKTKKTSKNADIAKTMRPISQFFTKFEYTKLSSTNKFTN